MADKQESGMAKRKFEEEMKQGNLQHKTWSPIADNDVKILIKKDHHYGGSWKKRGGVGAFMMLARKWDRIETLMHTEEFNYDLFKALEQDQREEDVLEDIQDLRRYLILVEGWLVDERRGDNAQP